jgi:hypothetical protein
VIVVRLKSRKKPRKPRKPDVWVTEIRVRDSKVTQALRELIRLVRKYEDLS